MTFQGRISGYAVCLHCDKVVKTHGGTKNITQHFIGSHKAIYTNTVLLQANVASADSNGTAKEVQCKQQNIAEMFIKQNLSGKDLSKDQQQQKHFDLLMLNLITKRGLPADFANWDELKDVLYYYRFYRTVKLSEKGTILKVGMETEGIIQACIREEIEKEGNISITNDAGKSPNGVPLSTTTAHFVTGDFEMKEACLKVITLIAMVYFLLNFYSLFINKGFCYGRKSHW